jgi:hypothetical protein
MGLDEGVLNRVPRHSGAVLLSTAQRRFAWPTVATFAAVLLTIACSESGEQAPVPASPPEGFQRYESQGQGFSIDVPEGWLVTTEPFEYVGELLEVDQFYGPQQIGPDGESFNVNVAVRAALLEDLGDQDEFYELSTASRQQAHPDLKVEDISIAHQAGKLYHYTTRPYPENPLLDQSMAVVLLGDVAWTVSLSVVRGTRGQYLATFHQMLESFRSP